MPWVEAWLRGQKVLARAKPDGSLDAEGGRVEIRYKRTDAKAYRASAGNLQVVKDGALLPDDTCVPGELVVPKAEAASQRAASGAEAQRGGRGAAPARAAPTVQAEWIAYTDGACTGNPGPAGAGMVVIAPGGKIHEGFDYLGTSTNNVGELSAILLAIEAIPRSARSIAIFTDSKYAIGVLSKGWKAKANQALIAKTKAALEGRNVLFEYVAGHSGIPMNERADELAREAIQARASRPLPKDL